MLSYAPNTPDLPKEIVEQILSYYVDSSDHDPAYQWTHLRRLSSYQKGRIELFARVYWVPRMEVELHLVNNSQLHFVFDGDSTVNKIESGVDARVCFTRKVLQWSHRQYDTQSWYHTRLRSPGSVGNPGIPSILVMLKREDANSVLKTFERVSDVELASLEVIDNGERIIFNWYQAMSTILHHIMFTRQVKNIWFHLLAEERAEALKYRGPVPENVLAKFIRARIRFQKRVLKLRLKTYGNKHLDGEPPSILDNAPSYTPIARADHIQTFETNLLCQENLSDFDILKLAFRESGGFPLLPVSETIKNPTQNEIRSEEDAWTYIVWSHQ